MLRLYFVSFLYILVQQGLIITWSILKSSLLLHPRRSRKLVWCTYLSHQDNFFQLCNWILKRPSKHQGLLNHGFVIGMASLSWSRFFFNNEFFTVLSFILSFLMNNLRTTKMMMSLCSGNGQIQNVLKTIVK